MNPPGPRALIAIGVAAYLIFAAAEFPAHVATRWFLPENAQASGVEGTLWRGNAARVAVDGTVVGPVSWRLRPLSLFMARLAADVDLELEDNGVVKGRIALTPGGRTYLRGIAGVVPLAAFSAVMPSSIVDGRVGLDIASAVLDAGWPVDMQGTIDLVDLEVVAPVQAPLGTYEVTFAGAGDESLEGQFREVAAPLDAEGTVSLHTDGRWQVDGTVATTPTTPAQLTNALRTFSSPDGQGRYPLSFSGER